MTSQRTITKSRTTKETSISVSLNLDGTGQAEITTGIGFFDHMLEQLARHSLVDMTITAKGDLHVDGHHVVEDVGLTLGEALRESLGDKKGITRYGQALIPMDETLARVAMDFSGRGGLVWDVPLVQNRIGDMDAELFREFFAALAQSGGITLHVASLYGTNTHHRIEGVFKATARALRMAIALDPRAHDSIPSTKGVL